MNSIRFFDARPAPGFTLIELLITMVVAGVLTAMAVPAFNSFIQNDRDIGQANSLVSSLNFARSEAVKENIAGGLTVCPSMNGTACGGTAWTGGWIVVDALGDPPLLVIPALAGTNTLTPSAGVTFLSTGLVNAPMTITICDVRGPAHARDVEVNATGRVSTSQTPGFSVAGTPLTCP